MWLILRIFHRKTGKRNKFILIKSDNHTNFEPKEPEAQFQSMNSSRQEYQLHTDTLWPHRNVSLLRGYAIDKTQHNKQREFYWENQSKCINNILRESPNRLGRTCPAPRKLRTQRRSSATTTSKQMTTSTCGLANTSSGAEQKRRPDYDTGSESVEMTPA